MNLIFTSTPHIKNLFLMAIGLTVVILFLIWNSSINNTPRFSSLERDFRVDNSKVCSVSFEDKRPHIKKDNSQNVIYFVTPTYPRPEQSPELTRLGQTLMHIPHIHWIVADDHVACSPIIDDILRRTGLPFTHIMSPMPEYYQKTNLPPRGVANRRAALNWIHKNVKQGVIYFGDDDNTFDLRLFDEIRDTKKISMFPVGLIGDYGISSPVVYNGKVIGFFDSWPANRIWPVDMAGFAINIAFLKPNASMPFKAGYEEDQFLRNNHVTLEDIEPKANNCTEVYVWHTQTRKHAKSHVQIDTKVIETNPLHVNLVMLIKKVAHLGMSVTNSKRGAIAYISKEGKSKIL